jgi:protein-tyrosine phosphatase
VFQRILVVCIGNICRSPIAETLLRERVPGIATGSAGLGAMAGHAADPLALAVLAEHGFDASQHVARQLDDAMIREADLILAMEQTHIDTLLQRAPHARGRAFLLGQWQDGLEIPDPYRQQRPAFEHVYRLIDATVDSWVPHLNQATADAHARRTQHTRTTHG